MTTKKVLITKRDLALSLLVGLAWGLIFLGLLIWALPAVVHAASPCYDAQVVSVHDGDTFDVQRPGQQPETIRLNHIDTPELEARDRNGKLLWTDQPYARDAARALWWLAWGEQVRVCPRFKSYERTGATVYLHGRDLAEPLAARGLGWVSCRASCPRVRQLADEAKAKGLGLWADPHPCRPSAWRKGECK